MRLVRVGVEAELDGRALSSGIPRSSRPGGILFSQVSETCLDALQANVELLEQAPDLGAEFSMLLANSAPTVTHVGNVRVAGGRVVRVFGHSNHNCLYQTPFRPEVRRCASILSSRVSM